MESTIRYVGRRHVIGRGRSLSSVGKDICSSRSHNEDLADAAKLGQLVEHQFDGLLHASIRMPLDRPLIEQASVVARILTHVGLPTEVPIPRPPRAPPMPRDAAFRWVDDDLPAA